MGNNFAYLALIAWPLISVFFFKRFDRITATFCTIVGGLLLLPVKVEIDFPMVPPFDKSSISVLSALFCLRFVTKQRIRLLPVTRAEKLLTILLLVVPIITVYNNQESVTRIDGLFLAGLTYHDAASDIIRRYLLLIPFIIGVLIVRSLEDQVSIFKLATIAGLAYTLPILFEVRMSPQLHDWIYGFFPSDFGQQKRYGGFRPVVFLGHGLEVAIFMVISLATAAALWREKIMIRNFSNTAIVVFLFAILVLCKSAGALILGVLLLIAFRVLKYKLQMTGAISVISLFLLYPLLTIGDMIPHQALLDWISGIDPERSESLQFRFYHEAGLVEHAREKLYFGWGGWGRNELTSKTVTDGAWIIFLGRYGLIGFLAIGGLAWLAVWKGYRSLSITSDLKTKNLIAMHALIVSVIFIDQLPNASWNMWTWFLTGALVGRTIGLREEAANARTARATAPASF
jgi:hypothetical protein